MPHYPIFNLWSKVKGNKKFSKHIEIIEEATLTPKEVSEIINIHNEEYKAGDKWNDIGFREEGNDTTRWFSSYVNRERILLEPLKENSNYYPADIVLSELSRLRSDLLLQISVDEQTVNCANGEENAA